MGVMSVAHPDIERFIHFKSSLNNRNSRVLQEYHRNLGGIDGTLKGTKYEKILAKTLTDDQLTHFNVSVLLSDDFMSAVENDGDWNLISPSTGKTVRTVKSRHILQQMAEQAWESGDPGILMEDAMNKESLVNYLEAIRATNP